MSNLTTCLLLACCVAYLGNVLAVIGRFDAANGYSCFCDIEGHGHRRELHINCTKNNAAPYHCIYSGDPHSCRAYNKDKMNKLNKALVKILGNDGQGACHMKSVEAAMCPGVVYERIEPSDGQTLLEEIIFKEMEFAGY